MVQEGETNSRGATAPYFPRLSAGETWSETIHYRKEKHCILYANDI